MCSGIGGLDLALRRAVRGARTVCYVEREAYAAAVLARAMAQEWLDPAPIWTDLARFPCNLLHRRVDFVMGGIPCQPHSVAGSRRGMSDERNLWPDFWRITRQIGASALLIENVRGFLRSGLPVVLEDVAAAGWDAEWTCLRASDVGAPHRRERVFLLAWRAGSALPDALGDALRDEPERGARAARPAEPGHAEPRDVGEGMAHADRYGLERRERAEVADADGWRHEAAPLGSGRVLADADGAGCLEFGLEERAGLARTQGSVALGHGDDGWLGWPPGPDDAEGWIKYLAAGGPQPALRRGSDGLRRRVDRLRGLGNAVVPAQGERAIRELVRRMR